MTDLKESLKRARVYKKKNDKKGYVDDEIKPSDRNRSEYPTYYDVSDTVDIRTDPGLPCPETTSDKNTDIRTDPGLPCPEETSDKDTDIMTDPGLPCPEESSDIYTVTIRTTAKKTDVARKKVREILSKSWHPDSTTSSLLAKSLGKGSLSTQISTETKSASAGKSIDITNNWEDVDEQIIAENLSELTGDIAKKIQELSGQVQHITTKPEFALTQEERKLIEEFIELIELQSFLENPHECLATQCSFID